AILRQSVDEHVERSIRNLLPTTGLPPGSRCRDADGTGDRRGEDARFRIIRRCADICCDRLGEHVFPTGPALAAPASDRGVLEQLGKRGSLARRSRALAILVEGSSDRREDRLAAIA